MTNLSGLITPNKGKKNELPFSPSQLKTIEKLRWQLQRFDEVFTYNKEMYVEYHIVERNYRRWNINKMNWDFLVTPIDTEKGKKKWVNQTQLYPWRHYEQPSLEDSQLSKWLLDTAHTIEGEIIERKQINYAVTFSYPTSKILCYIGDVICDKLNLEFRIPEDNDFRSEVIDFLQNTESNSFDIYLSGNLLCTTSNFNNLIEYKNRKNPLIRYFQLAEQCKTDTLPFKVGDTVKIDYYGEEKIGVIEYVFNPSTCYFLTEPKFIVNCGDEKPHVSMKNIIKKLK